MSLSRLSRQTLNTRSVSSSLIMLMASSQLEIDLPAAPVDHRRADRKDNGSYGYGDQIRFPRDHIAQKRLFYDFQNVIKRIELINKRQLLSQLRRTVNDGRDIKECLQRQRLQGLIVSDVQVCDRRDLRKAPAKDEHDQKPGNDHEHFRSERLRLQNEIQHIKRHHAVQQVDKSYADRSQREYLRIDAQLLQVAFRIDEGGVPALRGSGDERPGIETREKNGNGHFNILVEEHRVHRADDDRERERGDDRPQNAQKGTAVSRLQIAVDKTREDIAVMPDAAEKTFCHAPYSLRFFHGKKRRLLRLEFSEYVQQPEKQRFRAALPHGAALTRIFYTGTEIFARGEKIGDLLPVLLAQAPAERLVKRRELARHRAAARLFQIAEAPRRLLKKAVLRAHRVFSVLAV